MLFMQPDQITRCESTSWDLGHRRTIPIGLTAEIITVRDALESYAGEWNALLEQSAARTIFLTWEWISAWLDAVQPDARLLVVIVRDRDGRLIAIAPFYRTRMRLLGLVPYQCLRVIGDCDSGAEYPDVIIRHGFEDEAMSTVLAALLEHGDMWDCIWLPNVAGWTGAYERFRRGCDRTSLHLHQRARTFAAVKLPCTHEAFLMSLSHKRRAYVRRETRRLLRSQRVELAHCDTKTELPDFLAALFRLHHRHWASLGENGSFARHPRMASFYERFAAVALEKGWLRLYALKVCGAIKAVQYGYAYQGSFHAMQEGYDPNATHGIGNVLRNLVFEACIDEGLKIYDFLGGFTDHKRLWRAKERSGHDLFLGRRSLKNRLLFTQKVWPTGKYMQGLDYIPLAWSS